MIGKTLLRWSIAVLAILAIILIVMLTPLGLKIGMSLATKLVPGHLQYKQVSGMVTGPIEIKGFQYNYNGMQISIEHFKIRWRPLTLLWGKLTITKLDANRVYLTLGPSKKPPSSVNETVKTGSKKSKAFFLQIDQANLRNVAIGSEAKKYPIFLNQLRLKSRIAPEKIVIQSSATLSLPFPMQVRLNATGNFSKYTLTLRLNSPHLNWVVYGKGNDQSVYLHTQKSRTLGGSLSANVKLRWELQPQWNIKQWNIHLNAQNLNLNQLKNNWPHQLSIQLNTQGQIIKQMPHFSVTASITTPQAKINLHAKQNTTLEMQWNAAISQLASLIPGGRGSLYSKGKWAGTLSHPTTQGDITANHFSLYGYRADNLTGHWNINIPGVSPETFNPIRISTVRSKFARTSTKRELLAPLWKPHRLSVPRKAAGTASLYSNKKQSSYFNITATGLSTKSISLPSLQLQGSGSQKSHRLSGKIGINKTNFIFQMQGGLFGKQWKGKLKKLNILSKQFSDWRLAKPSTISFSLTQIITPNLCVRSSIKNSLLCFDGRWESNKAWAFTAKGKRIDPGVLTHLFLPKLTLSAATSIDARVTGYGEKLKSASAKLSLRSGRFRYNINGYYIGSPFQRSDIVFNLDTSGLRSKINTTLSKNNTINIALSLPHLLSVPKDQTISGQIRANLTNLNLLSNIIPDVAKPSGTLKANLSIHGTFNRPRISGNLSFHNGRLALTRLGIEFTQINIDLSSDKSGINYIAKAYSKDKPIQIKGRSEWTSKGLKSDFTVEANNALIMNTSEYIIYASPKLQFHIVGMKLHMHGDINIPKGLIQPYTFHNVEALPTHQIVYIGKPPEKSSRGWKIFAKVNITLGKDVTVNTSGLHADITGQVTLIGNPKQTTLANGRINITKGKYTTYGKTLKIQPSSFIQFINSPASNPSLNIRAIKEISVTEGMSKHQLGTSNIIVGVFLTGTFQHLKIKLFSIPATLSQADILSYLVLGYSSSANTGSSSSANIALLLEAASSLQLGGKGAGIGGAVSQIKQGLALTELGVESQALVDAIGNPVGQETAFVIGKHLTRRIYIRYSIGLGQGPFAPVNIFQLRYLLGKSWALQTDSSSLGNGIDILYTIGK